MTMNSSGAISLAGSTAGQSIAVELGQGATSQISLNDAAVRSLAGIASGAITMPTNFWGKSNLTGLQKGIFAFGSNNTGFLNISHVLSSTGVLSGDQTGVGTKRFYVGATGYGADKGVFAYANTGANQYTNVKNLVSNTGVVAADQAGSGTNRGGVSGTRYGTDTSIFAYGQVTYTEYNMQNKVSNTGVIAGDTAGVGTSRSYGCACPYGGDKGIFMFGSDQVNAYSTNYFNMSNKVSNTGVIAGDTTTTASLSGYLAASTYGGDKGIVAYKYPTLTAYNLVSNAGNVSSDTTFANPQSRNNTGGMGYGGDKGAFIGGGTATSTAFSLMNLVSNTGVIGSDQSYTGSSSYGGGGTSISLSA